MWLIKQHNIFSKKMKTSCTGFGFVNDICETSVFVLTSKGIDYYKWCIGARPGYCDIMPYLQTREDFANTDSINNLHLEDGHQYYISVQVKN